MDIQKDLSAENLSAMRWPSAGAAQVWLRRRNTSAEKLGMLIGMAPDTGVCLEPDPHADEPKAEAKPKAKPAAKTNGSKPAPKAKAVKAEAKPKAAPKAEAKMKPAKADPAPRGDREPSDFFKRALKAAADRAKGISRSELTEMNGNARNWSRRLPEAGAKLGYKVEAFQEEGSREVFYRATRIS